MSFEQIAGAIVVVVLCLLTLSLYPLAALLRRAGREGVSVSITDLVGMRMRNVPTATVVDALIQAKQAGLSVTARELEAHHLAGGNVRESVEALVRGKSGITFAEVAAAELAGHDVSRMSADEIRKIAGQHTAAT